MIVADASLLAYLLIPSSESALAEGAYRKEGSAPVLWRSELRSILLKHMRHSGMKIELATPWSRRRCWSPNARDSSKRVRIITRPMGKDIAAIEGMSVRALPSA